MLRIVDEYVRQYCNDSTKETYWVTGHSRGAGIANLVGANLTDQGNEAFVYTFAAPNCTTAPASQTAMYNNIFNIVNVDDIIAELPLTDWQFGKYGVTKSMSVGNNYKSEWETITSEKYKYNIQGKDELRMKFAKLATSGNDCYVFKCDCHGDGSDINTKEDYSGKPVVTLYGKDYAKLSIKSHKFVFCQSTAYFMQHLSNLAAHGSDTGKALEIIVNGRMNKKYEDVKFKFITYSGNMKTPHFVESYYYLTKVLNSKEDNNGNQ